MAFSSGKLEIILVLISSSCFLYCFFLELLSYRNMLSWIHSLIFLPFHLLVFLCCFLGDFHSVIFQPFYWIFYL